MKKNKDISTAILWNHLTTNNLISKKESEEMYERLMKRGGNNEYATSRGSNQEVQLYRNNA